MRDIKERIELEEKIKQGSNRVDDYFDLGALYLDSGKYDNLMELYKQIENLPLSKVEIGRFLYEKGEALQLSNKIDEAITSYEKSLQIIPLKDTSIQAFFLKGLNHYNLFLLLQDSIKGQQHAKEAVKYFNLIIEKYPNYEEKYGVYSYLADTYGRIGEYETSLHFYNLSIETSSTNSELVWALTGIGTIYRMEKKYKKAAKYFDKALHKANVTIPTSKIYYEKGKMFFEGNYLPEADTAFKNALNNKKNDPGLKDNQEYEIDILWHLGTIAYEMNNEKNVPIYFEKVLKNIDNNHYYYANSHLTLGHFYLMVKDYEKAREYYNNVLLAPSASDEEIKMAKECLAQIPFDS